MKKTCIASVFLAMLLPFAVFGADKVGEVAYLKGEAKIQRNAQSMNAALKMTVMQGDTIKTSNQSVVKILCTDDSVLTIQPGSTLLISEYVYNTQQQRSQSLFKLLIGKLRTVVGRAALKVSTDTAVAGVRGTVFDIWVDSATHTTYVSVIEGSVELRNISPGVKGLQIVTGGNTSSVTGGMPPTVPVPFSTQQPGTGGQQGDAGTEGSNLAGALLPPAGGTSSGESFGHQTVTNTPPIHQTPQGFSKVGINVVFP